MTSRKLLIDARYTDRSGLYRVATKTTYSLLFEHFFSATSPSYRYFTKIIVLVSCPDFYYYLQQSFCHCSLTIVFSRCNALSLLGPFQLHPFLGYTYIHFHSVPLFTSLFCNLRIIYIHDALPFINPWSFRLKLLKLFLKFYCKLSYTHTVSPSRIAMLDVKTLLSIPDNRSHYIYNGIDSSDSCPEQSFKASNRIVFLSLGNIKPHKNLEISIEAFNRFTETHSENLDIPPLYLIIGKPYDKDYYHKLCSLVHSNVVFTGQMSDTELHDLLPDVTCLLFPSLHEGFGLPIAEMLYRKIPVICLQLPVFEELYSFFPCYSANSSYDFAKLMDVVIDLPQYKDINFWNDVHQHLSKYSWINSASELLSLATHITE